MNSERYVKIVERADGKWDWHMIANNNGEQTFGTSQGFTDAKDARRSVVRELEALHCDSDVRIVVVSLGEPVVDE